MFNQLFKRGFSLRKAVEERVVIDRERLAKLKKEHGTVPVDKVTLDQLVRGLKGVKALLTESSRLDPYKGIKFRGMSIPECQEKLPAKYREILPESMFWLLLTGSVPTAQDVEELRKELASKARVPDRVKALVNSLPKNMSPITQLSLAVVALGESSHFDTGYNRGMRKTEYWKPMLEDCVELVAKIPTLAAMIYRNLYRDGKTPEPSLESDMSENFGTMMGFSDYNFYEMLRLYTSIHCDHEGGNVTNHTAHLVGSALSDAYKSYAAGLCGLAGPLHGTAKVEYLKWLLELHSYVGDDPTEHAVEVYVRKYLAEGKKIPGYGHPVLRIIDPRFVVQVEFAKKSIEDSPLCRLVTRCYNVIPKVLKELGKVANPYPNADACSGAIIHHFGVKELDFYPVFFAVSRSIGCASNLVWARALGFPIERPGSLTLENLEEVGYKTNPA